jgi:hypothetical protein
MGVKAEVDKPPSGWVTGQTGSYSDLVSRTDTAHREAIYADAGFGLSIVAGITAAVLYFARTSDSAAASTPPAVSPTPVTGGGGLVVQGSF